MKKLSLLTILFLPVMSFGQIKKQAPQTGLSVLGKGIIKRGYIASRIWFSDDGSFDVNGYATVSKTGLVTIKDTVKTINELIKSVRVIDIICQMNSIVPYLNYHPDLKTEYNKLQKQLDKLESENSRNNYLKR